MENFCKLKELYKLIHELEATIQNAHGLSVNECMAICSIKNGFKSAGELADNLSQSKSRMSKILSTLEKKDLIKREFDRNDKRKTIFKLTKQGLAKAKEVEKSEVYIPDFEIKCEPN